MYRISNRTGSYSKRPTAHERRKFRTLASLLDSQPKGLTRNPSHRLLWDRFIASEKLQKIRISPRCWRLLNDAKIPPENLTDFYKTYGLPEDPFFPLFLSVKSEWLKEMEHRREERQKAIMDIMRNLPEHRRRALRILAEYERKHHRIGDNPLWENRLYPKTLKQARMYAAYGETEWFRTWREYLNLLSLKYRDIPPLEDSDGRPTYTARILSTLILRCKRVDRREVSENFRTLSKEFHPDRGGDAECFRRLKEARDTLLS